MSMMLRHLQAALVLAKNTVAVSSTGVGSKAGSGTQYYSQYLYGCRTLDQQSLYAVSKTSTAHQQAASYSSSNSKHKALPR
jgi:hypothetical protein